MATIGVTTQVGSVGPSGTPDLSTGNYFVAGQSPWGVDSVAVPITSMDSYVRAFGGLNKLSSVGSPDVWTYETTDAVVQTYYAVKAYFSEKGNGSPGILYFSRTVATSGPPVAASGTFSDGSTHNTTVTSKWKAAAGNTVTVAVTNPSPKGSAYARLTVSFPHANITENWDIANAADALSASQKSQLVTVTLPAGGQLPMTAAATKLTAGTDVYTATSTDLVGTTSAANVKTGIQAFNDMRYGLGYVAIPGHYDATARTGIKTHVEAYYRLGVLSSPSGITLSTAATDLGSLASNYLAYYTPQIKVADENSDTNGILTVDNSGAIAGLAARMIRDYGGPHKSPAGKLHQFSSVLGLEVQSSGQELYDDAGSNTLADSLINTLRLKPGPMCWGSRTLATDRRYLQFNAAQTIAQVIVTGQLILENYVQEPIDDKLFAKVRSDFKVMMLNMFRAGSFYGDEPGKNPQKSDAFVVVCDRTNNPDEVIVNNQFRVGVSFVATPNAESIVFNVSPAAPGFVTSGAR